MTEQIKHAFEEYRKAVQAEAALTEEIQGREDKRPTAEDQTQFERMEADIDLWRKETQRLLKVAERSQEVDELRTQFGSLFQQDDTRERQPVKTDGDRLMEARASILAGGEGREFDSITTRAYVRQLANRFDVRALASPGGTAIDTTFIDQVLFYEVDESPMLDPAVVDVRVTTRGEPIYFPRLTADANVAGTLTAEAAQLNEADPTLGRVELNAYKYGGITLWSSELDEDDVIGIQDVLARSLARHIVEQVNGPLTTGGGSNAPNGIITAAANGGTAAGTANNTFFGPDDVIDLFYGRKPAYRRRGNWLASTGGLAKIRKLQDSTGQKIWQPSLIPGAPETVLGRPIFENPDMAAVASASKSVLFGDTHAYVTRRVGSARIAVSRDYKFNTDELAVRVTERIDGDLLDANAVAYLVSAVA